MAPETITGWFCPECGEFSLRRWRHLHSLNEPPYSKHVPLVPIEYKKGEAS